MGEGNMDSVEVYEVLVKQHEAMLLAYVLGLTRDLTLAEEVVQEAFVVGFQKLHQLREKAAFAAWIRAVARNLALAELRHRNREIPINEEIVHGMEDIFGAFDQPLAGETWPDRVQVVQRCFERLPSKLHEVTRMHYFEDQSIKQISALLNVGLDAVKKRLERARDAIRQCAEKRLGLEGI
jgi:RNA polymerase sigma factor (sigma-70 family)